MDEAGDLVLRTPALNVGLGGYIDLNDNEMIVDYSGASPLSTIQSLVTGGYADNTWTGYGIRSALAAENVNVEHKTAVGYAEASDVFSEFPATFAGGGGRHDDSCCATPGQATPTSTAP